MWRRALVAVSLIGAAGAALAIDYRSVSVPAAILYDAPSQAGKKLYLIKGQTPVAINLVARDAQGLGLLVFQVPGALSDYDVAAVTVERGFVPAPTSQPVLAGNL